MNECTTSREPADIQILRSLVDCFVDIVSVRPPSQGTNNGWIFECAGNRYIEDLLWVGLELMIMCNALTRQTLGDVPGVTTRYATPEECVTGPPPSHAMPQTPTARGEASATPEPSVEADHALAPTATQSAHSRPSVDTSAHAPEPNPQQTASPAATPTPAFTPGPAELPPSQGGPGLPSGQVPWLSGFGGATIPTVTPVMVPRSSLNGEGQDPQPLMFIAVSCKAR